MTGLEIADAFVFLILFLVVAALSMRGFSRMYGRTGHEPGDDGVRR